MAQENFSQSTSNRPENLETKLFRAVRSGDLATVRSCVDRGVNLHCVDPDDVLRTPLHVAAKNGEIGCMIALLNAGADIESLNALDQTPLSDAIGYKGSSLPAISLLILRGANLDAADRDGYVPLNWAVMKGDLSTVEKLIKEGAQVQVEYGESPFYTAAEWDKRSCMVALLRAGVDFNREIAPAAQVGDQKTLDAMVTVYCIGIVPRTLLNASRARILQSIKEFTALGTSTNQPLSNLKSPYIQAWILLSVSGLRKDLIEIFLDELNRGEKNLGGIIMRQTKDEVVDFLIAKLKGLYEFVQTVEEVPAHVQNVFNPAKVEETFRLPLKTSINTQFNELIRKSDAQISSSTNSTATKSSSATNSVSESGDTKN